MNKSYNSKLDVSSHPIPEESEVSLKQGENDVVFDPQKILHEISTEQDISIPQLQSEMKEMKMNLNQLILELGRVKKDICVRPTVNSMMENTILVTSMIQADPNIMKLLKSREDQIKNEKITEKEQHEPEKTTSNNELKELSYKLGSKLSNVNDGLSVLYTMFKELQKNSLIEIAQLRSFLEEKTHSIQDQINLMKIEEISERTSLVEKVEAQFETTQEKIRSIETKHTWETKELKNKLHEKLEKSIFEQAIEQTLEESKKMFKDFCESSSQLINPEKISQIESTINENKQKFIKDITECHLKVDSIIDRMTKELVGVEFYRKERTSIEKRLSNINMNFSEVHEKVTHLIKDSTDHESRISKLELEITEKTKTMKEMRATLRSLSITEEFQQMLSEIDPEKILSFENKINSLETENKQVYKIFGHVNEEIDKINSKFDIAGVLVPNQSREKNYELNDLREIIDEYFVENRFANKISKLESDINEGKASVEAIKLLEKKLSRLQKESEYNKIIQEFNLLEEKISKEMKILTEKLETRISEVEVQKSYIEGLITSTAKNRHFNNNNIEESEQLRRKLLMSESRSRMTERESNLYQRSSSMRKITSWETNSNLGMNKNVLNNSRIGKNTISSARKNLLLSNNLFLGN